MKTRGGWVNVEGCSFMLGCHEGLSTINPKELVKFSIDPKSDVRVGSLPSSKSF